MKLFKRNIMFALMLIILMSAVGCIKSDKNLKSDSGEYLLRAADCFQCHLFGTKETTPELNKIKVGEIPMNEYQFGRLIRNGKTPNGEQLPDVMPWRYYSMITDLDIVKMYKSYMDMTAPSVKIDHSEGSSPISTEYNRGAYLVVALGHCGYCHAKENGSQRLSGGQDDKGWIAYNISSDYIAGIGGWENEEIEQYLANGVVPTKGNAAADMGKFVQESSSFLTDSDRQAIASYLKASPAYPGNAKIPRYDRGRPIDNLDSLRQKMIRLDEPGNDDGKTLFNGYCATCHGMSGEGIEIEALGGFPSMVHNSTVGADTVNNLLLIVLNGTEYSVRDIGSFMPEFGSRMTDDEIASLINYIEAQFGDPAVEVKAADIKKMR